MGRPSPQDPRLHHLLGREGTALKRGHAILISGYYLAIPARDGRLIMVVLLFDRCGRWKSKGVGTAVCFGDVDVFVFELFEL